MVVRLTLPVRDNETKTGTSDACCAVQSEAVVKSSANGWGDRRLPHLGKSWPLGQAFGTWSDDDGPQIRPMRSCKISPTSF